jgi:hypothetical protein
VSTPCVPAVTKEISPSLETRSSKLRLRKPSSRYVDKQDVSQPNAEKSSPNRVTAINCTFQFKTGTMCYNEKNSPRSETLDQWSSTFFVRVPPDIISLQLYTPKVVGT